MYYQDPQLSSSNYLWLNPITTDSTGGYRRASFKLPTAMRADPTVTVTGATNGTFSGSYPAPEGNDFRHYVGFVGDTSAESKYAYIDSLKLDAEL